jgi:hypothetical protein
MKTTAAALCLAMGLFLAIPQQASAQDAAHSRQQIESVIETFRTAIIKKDKENFLKLFLNEKITWSGVTTDASIKMLYDSRPKPEMGPPAKVFTSNPREFIEMIAGDRMPAEETFANVRIDTDGEVAQVWFDYNFMMGSYRGNWGKESWQLVRTDKGWKIAAVVWSQEINPTPPPKP